jgi:dinuclear metal center YbgI/SA1388 family protein
MKITELIKILDDFVPKELALKNDKIGYLGLNPENINVKKIKIVMDLYPQDDLNSKDEEIFITHHYPLFTPKTPTYIIHSNWDVIKGGANDALSKILNLKVLDTFDKDTGIGRICSCQYKFKEFLNHLSEKLDLSSLNVVNPLDDEVKLDKIAIVSGFGLNNIDYIKLAKENRVQLFLSGDLTHKSAIFGKILDICLVDATHYKTEVPGLIELYNLLSKTGLDIEIIHHSIPWEAINFKS